MMTRYIEGGRVPPVLPPPAPPDKGGGGVEGLSSQADRLLLTAEFNTSASQVGKILIVLNFVA